MNFIDRLKNSLKTSEEASNTVSPDAPKRNRESAESLWSVLCENPNSEPDMPRLLLMCEKRGGPAAAYAALEELTHIRGSWLPQLYLGRMALEQKDFDEACRWYSGVFMQPGRNDDYALLMISADLGRYGFAGQMPGLISGVYNIEKNDVHIGLNLLKAYQDMHDPASGMMLLNRIQSYNHAEIQDYLAGFADVFASQIKEGDRFSNNGNGSGAGGFLALSGAQLTSELSGEETVTDNDNQNNESVDTGAGPGNLPRAVQVDVPIWKRELSGIYDLIPNTDKRKRVGVYMYADISAPGTPAPPLEDGVHPSDLAVSLPLYIGERLLFATHYAPIALYPVSCEYGPKSDSLEPDVQSLFSLCTKEALDFVITGTVFHDGNVFRIRSWILDRAKQSARIVSKDLPEGKFGGPFSEMIEDILLLFYDRRYVKPAAKPEFPYEIPSSELISVQLQVTSYFLYHYLVQQNVCGAVIMPDHKAMLDACACLAGTEPQNQLYLMMLLYAMKSVKRAGSDIYMNYRHLLYENADKSRYSASVKAVMDDLNSILKDKPE